MNKRFETIYESLVIKRPGLTLFVVCLLIGFLCYHIPKFRLDASSDSLLLENDQSLKYYRAIRARYGSDDYLVLTYTPTEDLFSNKTLVKLKKLREEILEIKAVKSVTSILDVPLLNSPPVSLSELKKNIPSLLDETTDKKLAKKELLNSPLYNKALISTDAKTTALLIDFHKNEKWHQLLKERNKLREIAIDRELSKIEKQKLLIASKSFDEQSKIQAVKQQEYIRKIREVISNNSGNVDTFLGGVPMITTDSIGLIRNDIKTFGTAILLFIILLLTLIFRSFHWVFLSMIVCFSVGFAVTGFLGFMNWPVTVVSSNFVSLLLIFTLSFTVHQIVRYKEYQAENPNDEQSTLVRESTLKIMKPCFYMVVTTMVAFGSLVVSDIRPVIDFGWMMSVGLGFAFIIAFTMFPAGLMFFKPAPIKSSLDLTEKITSFFARLIERFDKIILAIFVLIIILSVIGLQRLTVENRFIDYFKKDTAIYQGMEVIDRELGGTTPLDVIIDAPSDFADLEFEEEDDSFFEETKDEPKIISGYWFNSFMLDEVKAMHEYLDSLKETGKVLSFHSAMETISSIEEIKSIDSLNMPIIYKKLPDKVKEILFNPYISSDGNQIRFSIRVFESNYSLEREELINKIKKELTTKFKLEKGQLKVTGMLHLYNNLLNSLYVSQIKTIWVVFIFIFVMFSILFRSIRIASIAFLPNVTITALVLGIMGWFGIPLDIMTITIAAICTGTADDNTIHYVHRMRSEFKKHGNYWEAVKASHNTIGRAMYYTSITIMLGFSILAFSNFVPTIYFGLLTAFAMLVALLANLALLPLLIVASKPLGKERII